ncbi:MAG: hypothetical protein ABFD89_03690 [Bryobacteraceae bacterium]
MHTTSDMIGLETLVPDSRNLGVDRRPRCVKCNRPLTREDDFGVCGRCIEREAEKREPERFDAQN